MYPKTLKPHLRASMAAAWLFGMALGYWLAERAADAGPLEVLGGGLGALVLMSVVFSRIDQALLPKSAE